jgi:23S rRNA (pseudouridine1915-N3)-methyltransferase
VRFKLISVGRRRADPVTTVVDDYLERIRRIFPIEDIVLKAEKIEKINARILKETAGSTLVALDERGKEYDSYKFSALIDSFLNRGVSGVAFVIGGADGLSAEIKARADLTVALSKMTMPHRLARLFMVEQLYRALTIIRGTPYQK